MKNNQKCIRISDETLGYIEGFEGNGFNQKLENMTLYFMKRDKEYRSRIASLEREERQLEERIQKLTAMERDLKRIKDYISYARKITDDTPMEGQLKIV